MILLSGTSNLDLAQKISNHLNYPLAKATIVRFADREIYTEIQEPVRGKDVFVIQSTSSPANDYLMELLILIDALKRGSAKRINCVIPYFGYARQDRKTSSRSPISAKLVANMLTVAGADRIISLDLHTLQLQGFFDIPVDHLLANVIFAKHIKETYDLNNLVIASPDIGGIGRARQIAKYLHCDLAIIDKRRPKAGFSEVMNIIGNVEGRDCVLIDDIADSAGTICNAADALKEKGKANTVTAYCSHAVLSNTKSTFERIANSSVRQIICTDSIYISQEVLKSCPKLKIVTCSHLLASAIDRIHRETTTSTLFLNSDTVK